MRTKGRPEIDIDRWINQARMYIEEFEEGIRAEVVMMLVDEHVCRTAFHSHQVYVPQKRRLTNRQQR